MNISEIIKELNRLIKEKYSDFKGSYLYGSRAKGNFKEDSDIDVVVLFDELNRQKDLDICGIVGDIEYKYNVLIDFQVFTLDKLKLNPFYFDEVTKKGVFYAI
ncbi:MAG: nucleotidyltransferase domain-containing protein [bacterium]